MMGANHDHTDHVYWRDELRTIAGWISRHFPPPNGRCPEPLDIQMRQHARRLRAIADEPERSRDGCLLQGSVDWVAKDITDEYRCTEEEAEEFLDSIEDDLQVEMIQTGWAVIRSYCEFPSHEDEELE